MMRDKAVARAAVTRAVNGGANRAQAMRDQALSVAMKRKEEFLGARVPKELRDKVTARANEQGIPVSILIRNILEEAFKSHPVPGILPPAALTRPCATCMDAQVSREAGCRERPTSFPAVLGWEAIRLNRQVDCSSCGKPLLPGASVTVGLVSGVVPGLVQASAAPIILCDQCQGLM